MTHGMSVFELMRQAIEYQSDVFQRSVLFLDTLRERANNLFAHEAAGMPPLLDFDYEVILDARRFDIPANYALLRITRCHEYYARDDEDDNKPPVIVLDPRAGHGPGIGGFKHYSEVGMALHSAHPTYFVTFFPHPAPHQTLGDVLHALRRFVEEVSSRHDKSPVLYGNCQAGWAVMLLAAECAGLSGPAVLNGSPVSYWAGAPGVNPMRLAGGLLGGSWVTHLLTDLANGELDGAWLAANFENLNPANTLWDKNYKLFSNVDTERERFLEFERWWTGFYFLSQEEILFIVDNLFVGNKLERGKLRLDDCCVVNLKHVRSPIVIFASGGDNITPPQQALSWIPATYGSTAELKEAGQRIVYLLNQHVGHLGIFVSADVARVEHRAILHSLDKLDALKPGLYQMTIDPPAQDRDGKEAAPFIRFVERDLDEIRCRYPARAFEKVQALSEFNEAVYSTYWSPLIRACSNPFTAGILKWMHPMRSSRYVFSEQLNPWMGVLAALTPAVHASRAPVQDDNLFLQGERLASREISEALKQFQDVRDTASERLFATLFGDAAD